MAMSNTVIGSRTGLVTFKESGENIRRM